MPLILSSLTSDLESFFESPPDSAALCATEWSNILSNYTQVIVPPSTTVAAAAAILQASLIPIFSTSLDRNVTALQMETVFFTFAASVAAGMLPAFTGTPPTFGLIGFLSLFLLDPPSTHAIAADRFGSAIDTWMRLGIAVNTSTGASTNWT